MKKINSVHPFEENREKIIAYDPNGLNLSSELSQAFNLKYLRSLKKKTKK